jgi:hypothetical protein
MVDIGAYEVQSPASLLPYVWAQQYGLSTDGSADYADADGDGMNNWAEWRADTVPTNAASALIMGALERGGEFDDELYVSWTSVPTRSYWLERSTNLCDVPPFQTIATNIPGELDITTFSDLYPAGGVPVFYRVRVE